LALFIKTKRVIEYPNFLPVLANTKQVSIDLNKIYKKLKPYFKNIDY